MAATHRLLSPLSAEVQQLAQAVSEWQAPFQALHTHTAAVTDRLKERERAAEEVGLVLERVRRESGEVKSEWGVWKEQWKVCVFFCSVGALGEGLLPSFVDESNVMCDVM